MSSIKFDVERSEGASAPRAGTITTPHGSFATPAFCNVGTKGTVKGITPHDLKTIVGTEVALSNTYHLFLQPGE